MTFAKLSLLSIVMILLSACQSTTPTESTSPVSYTNLVEFNLHLNEALLVQDKEFFIDRISMTKALQIRQPSRSAKTFGSNWQQVFKNAFARMFFTEGSQLTWQYLGSEKIGPNRWQSLYRGISSEGQFSYVDFEIDTNYFTIVDVKNLFFEYSTLEFFAQVSDLPYCAKLTSDICDVKDSFNKLLLALGAKDSEAVKLIFKDLSAQQKSTVQIRDMLLRIAASMEAQLSVDFIQEIANELHNQGYYPTLFEGMYFTAKNYTLALKSLDSLDKKVRLDASVQMEKATIYAEMQQFEQAVITARAAIVADPNLSINYLVLLHIAFAGNDYDLAILTMNVIEEKFMIDIDEELLTEFEYSDAFMKSNQYRNWSATQKQAG